MDLINGYEKKCTCLFILLTLNVKTIYIYTNIYINIKKKQYDHGLDVGVMEGVSVGVSKEYLLPICYVNLGQLIKDACAFNKYICCSIRIMERTRISTEITNFSQFFPNQIVKATIKQIHFCIKKPGLGL